MKLYIGVRWGNAESPDGPDGEDTHFLIRAHDFIEAARLADTALRSLPTTSSESRRPVQPFCHRIIEIGSDRSVGSVPQVLMGPWVAYGYNVHHVSYPTWVRDEEKEPWQAAKDVFPESSLQSGTQPMQTTIGKTTLRLVTGDIADQDTDAVVTAAHWRLNKGNGTDGTIHTKGGPRIYEECRRIGGCPIGDAVITTGGNLKARHVIHAVGPVWRGGDEDEPKLLASAYRRSLEVAVQNGLRSISFPSISTGAFVYPIRLAAPVALKAIVDFLKQEKHELDEVRMVLYTRENDKAYAVYAQALQELLGSGAESVALDTMGNEHEDVRGIGAPKVVSTDNVDSAGPALRILYVENHAVFAASVINQFLTRHSVTVAPSLAEARRALETGNFNLLLVDYDLDDGKGDELVRELNTTGKPVAVIGVSSHDEGNTALLRAGAVAVCSKMQFDLIQTVIDTVTAYTKPSTTSSLLWWVVPGVLAGMPMPFVHPERRLNMGGALTAYEDELPALYTAGVRAVVCLLNIPSDAAVYESAGLAFKCLPVTDGGAPALEQAVDFITFVDSQLAVHHPVAVHCEAGLGRTGTMLATYLISRGESATLAISRVRAAERSAVETPRQIQFLEQFAAGYQAGR